MTHIFLLLLSIAFASNAMQESDLTDNSPLYNAREETRNAAFVAFHAAIPNQDQEEGLALLEKGILEAHDLDRSHDGQTLLMRAVTYNRLRIVDALLRHGADPDVTILGKNALWLACDHNNNQAIIRLLDAGAHPTHDVMARLDFRPQRSSCISLSTVELLLNAGAVVKGHNCIRSSYSFLGGAMGPTIRNRLRILMRAGIQIPSSRRSRHRTTLIRALYAQSPLIIALLIEGQPRFEEVLATREYGHRLEVIEALILAYGHEMFEQADQLHTHLQGFTQCNSEISKALRTTLRRAVSNGKIEIVRRIITLPEVRDPELFANLLTIAVMHGYCEIMQLIVLQNPSASAALQYCNKPSTEQSSAIGYFRGLHSMQAIYRERAGGDSWFSLLPRDIIEYVLRHFIMGNNHT